MQSYTHPVHTLFTPYTHPIHTLCTPYTHPMHTLYTHYTHPIHALCTPYTCLCTPYAHPIHALCTLYTHPIRTLCTRLRSKLEVCTTCSHSNHPITTELNQYHVPHGIVYVAVILWPGHLHPLEGCLCRVQ